VASLPFDAEFDVAGAFDVLEHIEDDGAAMVSIRRALKPGGIFVVTVPQHPWLWSNADVLAHHVRRYTRDDLVAKLADNGFQVRYVTSFMTLLLPLLAASRVLRGRQASAELKLSPSLNGILGGVMALERLLIRVGARFPAGGSLLAVAQKPDSSDAME
jgi:SAM-dependent methyltransferase